jgi:transcriptional regulator with XRE-family HTH domain
MNSKNIAALEKLSRMLEFKSEREKERLEEELLNLKFITAIEEIMELKDVNKSDLADILKSSRSYVSQLFSGNKMINIRTLTKIQRGLNISFKIYAIDNKRFEFQIVNCDLNKRATIEDYPNPEKEDKYIISKIPKKRDKIPA